LLFYSYQGFSCRISEFLLPIHFFRYLLQIKDLLLLTPLVQIEEIRGNIFLLNSKAIMEVGQMCADDYFVLGEIFIDQINILADRIFSRLQPL